HRPARFGVPRHRGPGRGARDAHRPHLSHRSRVRAHRGKALGARRKNRTHEMSARLGPLGHATGYPDRYDPSLLFAVARAPQRQDIGIGDALPFTGSDVWTAYEHTWLDSGGKPCIAMLSLVVPG